MLYKDKDQFVVALDVDELIAEVCDENGKPTGELRYMAGAGSQYAIEYRRNGFYYWKPGDTGQLVRAPIAEHGRSRKKDNGTDGIMIPETMRQR